MQGKPLDLMATLTFQNASQIGPERRPVPGANFQPLHTSSELPTGHKAYLCYAKPIRKLCEYYAKSLGPELREREKERKRERDIET